MNYSEKPTKASFFTSLSTRKTSKQSISTFYQTRISSYFFKNRNLLKDETIILYINTYKFKLANDIFGDGKYNFALYKYALEKVCDEERKERDEEERRVQESQPKVSIFDRFKNSNLYLFVSIGIIVFTISIAAANYYLYSQGASSKIISK